MRSSSLLFLLVGLWSLSFAQPTLPEKVADSLWTTWQNETLPDSARFNAIYHFAWKGYLFSKPDSAFYYADIAYEAAQSKGYEKGMKLAMYLQGVSWYVRGDHLQALVSYKQQIELLEKLGDELTVAKLIGNIGKIYIELGDLPKALDYSQRSLKIMEKLGDDDNIAILLVDIANIYRQIDRSNALSYYQRALDLFERSGHIDGLNAALTGIGNVHFEESDFENALLYYERSLEIEEEGKKNMRGLATTLHNIGTVYREKGEFDKAMEYYSRALRIREEMGGKQHVASTQVSIGKLFNAMRDHRSAITWCEKGLVSPEEMGVEVRNIACECLYSAWKALGDGNKALFYHEKMLVLKDSLQQDETSKMMQQIEFARATLQDSIARAEEARLVRETHAGEVRRKDHIRNTLLGGGVGVLLLAGVLWSRLRYTRRSKALIEKEKDRSENLLLNILPAEIAAELKEYGKADARDFENVSILFTDFKDFTEASERLGAKELVAEINTCFEAFDHIMGEYGIEKIKTIGDAYMAAGGLPVPMADSARNTVLAALEMQAFITRRKALNRAEGLPAFEMRVGVHTGPVIAGIVGVKKFAYDIWGDTVNTASRMESSGAVGMVNISRSTYELVRDEPGLRFTPRGMVRTKGKGDVEMFFVEKVTVEEPSAAVPA